MVLKSLCVARANDDGGDGGRRSSQFSAICGTLLPVSLATSDAASEVTLAYPYWHQRGFEERNPRAV